MICLPKEQIDVLKRAIRKGDFTIAALYQMTSEQRNKMFTKYVGKEGATFVNGNFEKAMVSKQRDSLKKWVNQTFGGKKSSKKTVIEKIEGLNEVLDVMDGQDFLRDLAAIKLGFTVTESESQQIVEKTQKIRDLQEEKSEIGLPSKEYLKAYSDMEKYIQSLNPTNQLRIMTSLWGRAAMLMRPSSIVLNLEGNTLNSIITGIEKRIGSLFTNGIVSGKNSDLVGKFVQENTRNYIQYGYDFSRMNELSDGQKILNEQQIQSEGKGIVRQTLGKFGQKFLKVTQGVPDVVFASRTFATTANAQSTAIAKSEGLKGEKLKERAREIMLDSFKMEPQTEEGQSVRNQAQADAEYATYTNNSFAAKKISLRLRQVFNDLAPNLRLGDLNIPFAKTPANIAAQGIEMAGGGFVEVAQQAYNLKKAWRDLGKGSPESKQSISRIIRVLSRMGLGVLISRLIVANIDDDDFIGAFPTNPSEQKLFEERNGIENSFRVGDKWVSTAYLGPLAPVVTGMLYAKKYKKEGLLGKTLGYMTGAGQGLLELPGFNQAKDTLMYVSDILNQKKGIKDIGEDALAGIVDFTRGRIIPGIVSDVAKASDDYERKTSGQGVLAPAKASIPGLRETLPAKQTSLGRVMKTEEGLSIFLFGSRVKTASDTAVIKEMVRLQEAGTLPALTDVEKTSSRVKDFKTQVSSTVYKQTIKEFRKTFGQKTADLIKTDAYKKLTDDEKKDKIDALKDDLLVSALTKNGYKKKRK